MKTKFEFRPYIISSNIGEIEVSIELSNDEIAMMKTLDKEEIKKLVNDKAVIKITDFDIDFEVEDFNDWDEVEI